MTDLLQRVFAPLAASPLLWLFLTLGAYLGARRLQRACGGAVWLNPVLISIVLVGAVVVATRTPYQTYFQGAQFIHFLLGPATVALGVPLARNLHHVRRSLIGVAVALLAGSVVSMVGGLGLVRLLGGSRAVAMSMAPKAATTPIAMAVSAQIGGIPSLTAALAIAGGIVAAILGQRMLARLRIEDWRAHGLAAGVAGSGIAAAQVAALDGLAAAFGALGVALNGLMTSFAALLAPLLWP
jgi:putative effector of murein hydrolase